MAPHVLAPCDLPQMCKYEPLTKCNAWGAKSSMLHDHAQLNHISPYKPFANLPLAFFCILAI
jgi:hypothetical protein